MTGNERGALIHHRALFARNVRKRQTSRTAFISAAAPVCSRSTSTPAARKVKPSTIGPYGLRAAAKGTRHQSHFCGRGDDLLHRRQRMGAQLVDPCPVAQRDRQVGGPTNNPSRPGVAAISSRFERLDRFHHGKDHGHAIGLTQVFAGRQPGGLERRIAAPAARADRRIFGGPHQQFGLGPGIDHGSDDGHGTGIQRLARNGGIVPQGADDGRPARRIDRGNHRGGIGKADHAVLHVERHALNRQPRHLARQLGRGNRHP